MYSRTVATKKSEGQEQDLEQCIFQCNDCATDIWAAILYWKMGDSVWRCQVSNSCCPKALHIRAYPRILWQIIHWSEFQWTSSQIISLLEFTGFAIDKEHQNGNSNTPQLTSKTILGRTDNLFEGLTCWERWNDERGKVSFWLEH